MFEDEKREELKYIIKNVPFIFKYTGVESFDSLISNSSLVFKNPSIFNDPYDCYPYLINFESIPDNFRQYLIEKYQPFLSPEIIKRVQNSSDSELESSFRDLGFASEISKTAISCFSEEFDNMLMWSHYSNAHEGVCIGFNLRKLYSTIESYHPALVKVKYTNKFIRTDYFRNPKEAIANWYRFKSDCWSYEKEIRIVLTNLILDSKKKIYIPITMETISSIYLGSKIESQNENKIRSTCLERIPRAKIYKMSLKTDSFTLTTE